jgi:hypothetical protein
VVGDWDGNRSTTVGTFDPGTATWYLRNSNSPGAPDVSPFAYGGPNWRPVVGDWDNDGRETVGVTDPQGTWYLRNDNALGAPDLTPFAYGVGDWLPVAGWWGRLPLQFRPARFAVPPRQPGAAGLPTELQASPAAERAADGNAGRDGWFVVLAPQVEGGVGTEAPLGTGVRDEALAALLGSDEYFAGL